MLSFASDYIEGAHPRILERFIETNMEQLSGYGTDCYTVVRFATSWATTKEKVEELRGLL